MKGIGWAVAAGVLGASVATAAPAPWFEIKSQHFTIVSNSGEKEARRTAWQFEQVRQALQIIWPWAAVDGGQPITVFAVRDENTLKTLGPQYWEGKRYRPTSFWVGDSDRTYIALRTDLSEPSDVGENPYQTAYWSYVSAVFHGSLPGKVPEWYGRGVSEVLSNTLVRDKELHVGRLMNNHLNRVREGSLIPLDEFLTAGRGSKYLTGEVESWQFESQAWAFVHYLMFGEKGAHNGKVNRFNALLADGTDADVALKEAFGPSMAPYYTGMREYTRRDIFQYGRIPVAVGVKMEGFTTRALSPVEGAQQRGQLLVAMNRPVEARAEAAAAAAAEPASPVPSEIEGALLDREGKSAEARAAYEKAVGLSSKRARVYYRLAQMIRPSGDVDRATNEKIASLLEKAIELEPGTANSLSYLADVQTDLGKPEAAVDLATRAVKLEPNVTYHRLALARALWNAKRADDSILIANSALTVADTDAERASAQRFLDFTARSPRPAAPRTAAPLPSPSPSASVAVTLVPESGSSAYFKGFARETSEVQRTLVACVNHDAAEACGKAMPVLDRLCGEQDGFACLQLGSFHDRGHGVLMSKTKAADAYRRGCAANDQASCARFAVLQAQGLGGLPRDAPAGLATLERLCNARVDDACLGWGLLLTTDIGWRDIPKARQLFKASCDRGNQEGCRLLQTVTPR
jgi:TPR repeat protein